ncbi:MAG: hypothetical protein IJH37_09895 [Clostridia bacterium]|nr:hypothetical protein [Clostridia bacterium]
MDNMNSTDSINSDVSANASSELNVTPKAPKRPIWGLIAFVVIIVIMFIIIAITNNIKTNTINTKTETTAPSATPIPYSQYAGFKRYDPTVLTADNSPFPAAENNMVIDFIDCLHTVNQDLATLDYIDIYDDSTSAVYYFGSKLFNIHMECNERGVFMQRINFTDAMSNPQYVKDVFAATVMHVDKSISLNEAKTKAQEIANSFKPSLQSEIFSINGYKLYTVGTRYYGGLELDELNVFDSNIGGLSEEEKAEYLPVDYDTAQNPLLNKDMKVKVTGIMSTYTLDNITDRNSYWNFIIKCSDGTQYNVKYNYSDIPHKFSVGTQYTLYCKIIDETNSADLPSLLLDWYE